MWCWPAAIAMSSHLNEFIAKVKGADLPTLNRSLALREALFRISPKLEVPCSAVQVATVILGELLKVQ